MRKADAAVFLFFVASSLHGEWTLNSVQAEPGAAKGIEHCYMVFENSESGDRASIELAIFSAKACRLRVIDQPNNDRQDLADVMAREGALAGVNGGYFDPDYNPIGLRIVNAKTIAPLKQARLLSGILISNAGKIQIVRISEFASKPEAERRKVDAAVECGPMLVDGAKPVHGLDSSRPARRTFAAVTTSDRAAIGFCSDVTLAELADILGNPLGDFKVQRAMNLDGGSSSAFWFKRKSGGAFSIGEEKDVRDFVAIAPR